MIFPITLQRPEVRGFVGSQAQNIDNLGFIRVARYGGVRCSSSNAYGVSAPRHQHVDKKSTAWIADTMPSALSVRVNVLVSEEE